MAEVYQVRELWVASRSESVANKKDGDDKMISTQDIIVIAKKYNAMTTEECHISWVETIREWHELKHVRPSILDALVLDQGFKVGPSYLEAIQTVTGWSRDRVFGFQTAMLLGGPAESAPMTTQRMSYWKGVLDGSFVYEKMKTRYV